MHPPKHQAIKDSPGENLMRPFSLLLAVISVFTMVTTSYAGPTTNLEEYQGDKELTKDQQIEYQRKLDLGIKHFEEGQYDQAEKEFKDIIAFAPKKNLAYFNLGLVKYRQGDYPAAISYFDTVIKKRSYYVGGAFYYKAIAQMNLEQNEEALKTAKRFTQNRFFYKPSQSLINSIKTGTDEYMENAKLALNDENFELCLLELEESVMTDTKAGKALMAQCKSGVANTSTSESESVVETLPNRWKVWLDTSISHSDNVYQEATNKYARYLYNAEVGAEYVWTNKIDVGIGASYEYSDANDLPNFRDETLTAYIPIFWRRDANRINAQLFYSNNKFDGTEAWSETGAFLNYFYSQEKYVIGLIGTATEKKSIDSAYDYKNGPFTSARLTGSRFIDAYTLSAYIGMDESRSGAQPIGGTDLLPNGYKANRIGASAAYDFNQKISRLTLRLASSQKDYLDVVSLNGTDRKDTTNTATLSYQHRFNPYVKAYLEQSYIKNDSNYDVTEVIDKNYTENLTTLGLSLVAF